MAQLTLTKNVCRICLQQIENEKFHFLNNCNESMLETKLLDIVPEIDLSSTPNAISCQRCTNTIQHFHEFKQMCLQTENTIKSLENSNCLKYTVPVPSTIKQELEDLNLEINTDLPVIIEVPQVFYCNDCDYDTGTKDHIIRHVRIHRKNSHRSRLHCNKCSFKTHCSENLKRHYLVHRDEKLFKCSKCNYDTNYKRNLRRHLTKHFRNRDEYKAAVEETYKPVQKVKKIFQCDQCSYNAKQFCQLKKHLLKHDTVMPFKCSICNYRSKYKQNLTLHISRHNDTMKQLYKCTHCSYGCSQLAAMNKHLLLHTDEKVLNSVKEGYD